MALRLVSITASIVLALGFGFGGSHRPKLAIKRAAIAGGIIAGAAIGAAVSSSINQPKTVYVPVPVAGAAAAMATGVLADPAHELLSGSARLLQRQWRV